MVLESQDSYSGTSRQLDSPSAHRLDRLVDQLSLPVRNCSSMSLVLSHDRHLTSHVRGGTGVLTAPHDCSGTSLKKCGTGVLDLNQQWREIDPDRRNFIPKLPDASLCGCKNDQLH